MIAPHILAISAFLSVMWGIYLAFTVTDYVKVKSYRDRRKGETVAAFRRMLVAFCVFSLPFSFVFRTACVILGIGDDVAGQVAFFALVGPNVVCSIFAVTSLRYD
jgi:hypothetical protein